MTKSVQCSSGWHGLTVCEFVLYLTLVGTPTSLSGGASGGSGTGGRLSRGTAAVDSQLSAAAARGETTATENWGLGVGEEWGPWTGGGAGDHRLDTFLLAAPVIPSVPLTPLTTLPVPLLQPGGGAVSAVSAVRPGTAGRPVVLSSPAQQQVLLPSIRGLQSYKLVQLPAAAGQTRGMSTASDGVRG